MPGVRPETRRAGAEESERRRLVKLLFDACLPNLPADALRSSGVDVELIAEIDPSAPDEEVLARARRSNRLLVTLDKDFGELAVAKGLAHCGILRLVDCASRDMADVIISILDENSEDIAKRSLIVWSRGRPTRVHKS